MIAFNFIPPKESFCFVVVISFFSVRFELKKGKQDVINVFTTLSGVGFNIDNYGYVSDQ